MMWFQGLIEDMKQFYVQNDSDLPIDGTLHSRPKSHKTKQLYAEIDSLYEKAKNAIKKLYYSDVCFIYTPSQVII